MSSLTQHEQTVAKQWAHVEKISEEAKAKWATVRRETKKLARIAGLGRKKSVTVRISETKAVRIKNQFRGEEEVFAPAFAKKFKAEEVKFDGDP